MSARKPLVLNGALVEALQSGDLLQLLAAVVGAASLNMPHGTAPTSPQNGDVWTTTAGIFVQINGSTVGPLGTGGGGGGDLGAFWAYEQQASGTAGGSSTANTWTTRVLNTNPVNTISGASISSNTITLPSGTYDAWATAPHYTAATNSGRSIRLFNSSDSTTALLGETLWLAGEQRTRLQGRFTLAASKNLVLQSIVDTAISTNGLGVNAGGMGQSVANHFSDIFIHKVA